MKANHTFGRQNGGITMRPFVIAAIMIVAGCAPMQSPRQTDNIALPFVDDPQVIGKWRSVDFVKEPDQFQPGQRKWRGDLELKELAFDQNGKTSQPWWTWTKGVLIHHGDKTAAAYLIKEEDNAAFMFLELKSGDYTIRRMKPMYYVLQKE